MSDLVKSTVPSPINSPDSASAGPTLERLAVSFRRSLAARNRSEATRQTYDAALLSLGRYLAEHGMPAAVEAVRREHLESFVAWLLAERSPSTAQTYYKSLSAFFAWCVAEDELHESPMRRMHLPQAPETLPPVLSDETVKRLLKACEGRDFEARRDAAILRLFLDTGMRNAELTGLTLERLDLDLGAATVLGKGNKWRVCPFGPRTAQAIDRYLRLRERHKQAGLPALWLGRSRPLSRDGVRAIVKRRGEQAGIDGLHPHLFRHKFSSDFLAQGGQESDLMTLNGWSSAAMLRHYGKSAATGRAMQAHKRLGLGERF